MIDRVRADREREVDGRGSITRSARPLLTCPKFAGPAAAIGSHPLLTCPKFAGPAAATNPCYPRKRATAPTHDAPPTATTASFGRSRDELPASTR